MESSSMSNTIQKALNEGLGNAISSFKFILFTTVATACSYAASTLITGSETIGILVGITIFSTLNAIKEIHEQKQ